MEEDGDSSARRDYLSVSKNEYSIVFNYGENFKDNTFADGVFKYAQKVEFGVTANYQKPLLNGLKNALKAGNCDIAQSILETLANGKPQNQGQDNEFLGFENGTDRCAIAKDGTSVCAFNKLKVDEQGNPIIGTCEQTNCDRDTLENYASAKQNPKGRSDKGSNNRGEPNANGSGINELRGSGGNSGSSSGSSSSGKGNEGTGKSEGVGNGKGEGSGTGKGQGDGKGENENVKADLSYPQLEEFDIRKVLSELKKSKEGFIPKLSLNGGTCPSLNITFASKFLSINETVDAHCRIFRSASGLLGSVFLFIWGIVSIRIVLSA
ncbi:hypothetical protein A6B39_04285 [Mannheimia granulomatis]|nr:hypothetical protein A6B39_04285 [Mannheimia granulomatis]